MTTILNLTQHDATPEQIAAGVVEPREHKKAILSELTFEEMPDRTEIYDRAKWLACYAEIELMQPPKDWDPKDCDPEAGFEGWTLPEDATAMIAGAPYLMSELEQELLKLNIKPVYAFSKRESVEETRPDGSVRSIRVFRHLGFVDGGSVNLFLHS
ncbi:MAG: hypothetical protein DRP42_06400 [Tenericutes bacterium]|nr:MAG: hypothetical protein DRP42_06400 [Mycoplasmatota bacterium]